MEKTALVVGTNFGENAARILSQDYRVRKVILSQTTLKGARELAEYLSGLDGRKGMVFGVQIKNCADMRRVVSDHNPDLTVICTPPDTHFQYTEIAIPYSDVLCEKPFTDSIGIPEHADAVRKLRTNGHRFGLELPMYFVGKELWEKHDLQEKLRKADSLKFVWETGGSDVDIIDDLLLHIWPLIPLNYSKRKIVGVDKKDRATAHLDLILMDPVTGHRLNCDIDLAYKQNATRGFSIGEEEFEVRKDNNNINSVVARKTGVPIATVDNPLKQHLDAMIERNPIVGIDETYKSQLFLEEAKGFRN